MLEIKNLSIKYLSTKQKVLESFNLKVGKGEKIAILGTSGCGKTTLLNAIQGLFSKKEAVVTGEIKFEKKLVVRTIFQEARLLPWKNVFNNAALGLEIKKVPQDEINRKVKKMLKVVGLENFEHYYPFQLSTGMKQRVNFVWALVCDPDVLLLDEPFSSVDHKTKENLQKVLIEIVNKNKITTILVTHSLAEAELLAEKIIHLDKKGNIKVFNEAI
jgi:ABC-type nitrate/sulfonate/bicarbonate transport system ATPase subunit